MPDHEGMSKHITVGFDGSPEATEALRWGTQEAMVRGCGLEIVTSYHLPLASDKAVIAAGMNKLIVAYTDTNTLVRYDLTTFDKEATDRQLQIAARLPKLQSEGLAPRMRKWNVPTVLHTVSKLIRGATSPAS